MFKNALLYSIDEWEPPTQTDIEQRLNAARFVGCSPSQAAAVGWVEPRGEKHSALLESVAGQLVLKLCGETKAVPSGVVKEQVNARLDEIEEATGRRPKGKAAREIKEQVIHELLPRAFPKRSTTAVWIDLAARRVLIGAASAKKADVVATQLVELFGGLKLKEVQTALSPAAAMATWLTEKQAPPGFSLDRECELKQPDSEKAAVRYARHALDIDELGQHISQGKLPTQLAMTWSNRVSFVLTDTLALKKIRLLDVVLEGSTSTEDGPGSTFDADVAIMTGELQLLLPDLIAALGGPLQRQANGSEAPKSPVAGSAPWDEVAA